VSTLTWIGVVVGAVFTYVAIAGIVHAVAKRFDISDEGFAAVWFISLPVMLVAGIVLVAWNFGLRRAWTLGPNIAKRVSRSLAERKERKRLPAMRLVDRRPGYDLVAVERQEPYRSTYAEDAYKLDKEMVRINAFRNGDVK
jgi:hypothetical protein